MRNSLWSVIAIVGAIMGFVMGYATAPMVETGMLTGKGGTPGPKIEASKDLRQYYQDLYKEK
jgi:hypothetical protein